MSSAETKLSADPLQIMPPLQSVRGLDRPSKTPLYELVKQRICERIVQGQWPPGYILPAENELASVLEVSVGTARRALADLTKQGWVVRRPRSGTVVTGRPPHHTLGQFYQYFRLHQADGSVVRSKAKTLDITVDDATAAEAKALRLTKSGPGRRVVRIDRVRIVNGTGVMLDRMVLPQHLIPGFPLTLSDAPELLYNYLLNHHGIRIAGVRESLGAELANPRDHQHLNFSDQIRPAAVLVIEEVAFDPKDVPIVYAIHRSTTDRYRYINEIR